MVVPSFARLFMKGGAGAYYRSVVLVLHSNNDIWSKLLPVGRGAVAGKERSMIPIERHEKAREAFPV